MAAKVGERAALPWSDRFRVGVEALDSDHMTLVRLINEVCSAWAKSQCKEALRILDALVELADEHVVREEQILREIPSYKHLASHHDEHENRLKQLDSLRGKAGGLDAAEVNAASLQEELVDWFVRQSIGHDAAIKAYFDDGRGHEHRGKVGTLSDS